MELAKIAREIKSIKAQINKSAGSYHYDTVMSPSWDEMGISDEIGAQIEKYLGARIRKLKTPNWVEEYEDPNRTENFDHATSSFRSKSVLKDGPGTKISIGTWEGKKAVEVQDFFGAGFSYLLIA